MVILGIDPGYAIVGFSVLSSEKGQAKLIGCGAINTDAGVPMPQRLLRIAEDLESLIRQFQPDVMAIEELFFNQNVKFSAKLNGKNNSAQLVNSSYNAVNVGIFIIFFNDITA